ncbi:helix-turn-helix transcriptional regulator [Sphingomonas sp. SUN019]|uniref:helix-turn-helix transcriptional regulator n=1 Tax=Sphingomonas sp. SUN019 TaxID=2937788 RepID=UPI0021648A9F|nr:helix-turn-helix transcriptional regulator [Sphingomonas sp. SUN019]UVO51555.1 helix-turn-helix transcriptional regulator [Sphingomonas sp. SUN019]
MRRHHGLADKLLAAAIEPDRWLGVLSDVAAACRSDHAQIIGFGPDYDVAFNFVSGIDAGALRRFDAIDHGSPLINYRVAASVAAGPHAVLHEAHYAAARSGLVNDAYLDLTRDVDIPHGCQTNLRRDEHNLLGFALLRSARSGPTTAAVRADFAELRDYAVAAAALQVALERQGHHLIAGSFDAMGTACFVLDADLRVRARTVSAEGLLRAGVVRLADGRVALPIAEDQRRLSAAMNAVASGRALAGHVVVPDEVEGGTGGVMTLKLHCLPARDWSMGFAPAAILVVKRSLYPGPIDASVLRDTYRLTAAEAAIALALLMGQPRAQICAARGITRETLRTHLRTLFAKLGVNREADAIHLLHAVLG